ncbi:zinc ribbon domain-containing protein [Bacillus timonensis]|uniref:zinc ribbon domain-containing protein n=1 Tax=Bacillus timonensis TaxID=1033734 RepID=UPI000289C04B|nr:zinc ribbon domain-containing protein [Bacillus timonensis]
MFCKNCGTKNSDGALYCSNDGVVLSQVSERVRLSRDSEKYCQHCGHENTVGGYYCVSCGHSFEKIVEKEDDKLLVSESTAPQMSGNVQSEKGLIASLTDKSTLIHSLKFVGMSIVILSIISFGISSAANILAREAISNELGFFGDLLGDIKLVTFTDVLMISHLLGLNFNIAAMGFEGSIQTSSGLFLLLIIPAVVFIVMGIFMQRKYPESSMIDRLTRSLTFSIPYAIILGLFSLFAGSSLEMKDPTGFTEGTALVLTSDYSFFESIFNAFIISFIFTSIGAMIRLSKEQRMFNYRYGLSISRAILHSIVGLTLAMVVGFSVISLNENIPTDNGEGVILGTQVGAYMWNVSQFETLKLSMENYGEEITASYSLLGGAEASMAGADPEDEEEFNEEFKEEVKEELGGFGLASWLLVIIVLGLHFWAGKQLIKSSQGNILYELGAYAVTFGLANALIVGLAKLSAEIYMDEEIVFSLGFSSIGVFLISTILAFIVSYGSVLMLGRQSSSSHEQRYTA